MSRMTHLAVFAALGLLSLGVTGSGQTFEASSFERDSFHPRHAFDDKSETRWSAKFSEKTGWIQVSHVVPRAFDKLTVRSGIRDLKGAPRDFDVLAGTLEKLEVIARVRGNDRDDRIVRFPSTTAPVWRVDIQSVVDTRWSPTITELVFAMDGKSGAARKTEATERPAVETSIPGKGRHGPDNIVDGDAGSRFEAEKRAKRINATLTWTKPQTFDGFELLARAEGGYGVPKQLTIEARSGRRWKKVATIESSFTGRIRGRFKETTAKAWRVVVTELVSPRGTLRINELRFVALGKQTWPAEKVASPPQKDVNRAIDRGMEWLRKMRRPDGNWKTSHTEDYPMGVMSLVGMALRKSGLDRDDPLMLELVEALKAMPKKTVYGVSLYMLFLRALSKQRYVDELEASAAFVAESQAPDGLWGYPTGRSDLSNAQYALLALKAASECGVDVTQRVWLRSYEWLLRRAQKDGGFNYVPHGKGARDPATGSMTAAALACLKICRNHLPKRRDLAGKADAIENRAMTWLASRFVVDMNPGSSMSHYYYLYGIERVGAFYGIREIGEHPWYAAGARHLLDWQRRDGSWRSNIVDTCFALLFLNRASVTGD